MRIAFVSYEYPPETGGGGIGTYLKTVVVKLTSMGHDPVIFTATDQPDAFWENGQVYRIPAKNWIEFNLRLPQHFKTLHQSHPFDVLECTDFMGCGLYIKKALPHLPTVVRLHTPLYLVDQLQYKPLSFLKKVRFVLGAIIRFKKPVLPKPPSAADYKSELEMVTLAEVVSSPGLSISQAMASAGFSTEGKTEIVPLPFDSTPFEEIQSKKQVGKHPRIGFIGRMEVRKGVLDLANAIPLVIQKYPEAKFVFIGSSAASPKSGVDMETYLKKSLSKYLENVQFYGPVEREQIPSVLELCDILVFPSHYESFGLVCCEAMAAGKAVIGSQNGGMAEIIEDGISGQLCQPKAPRQLAKKIQELIANNELRLQLGAGARVRIKQLLAPDKALKAQIATYQKARQEVERKQCTPIK